MTRHLGAGLRDALFRNVTERFGTTEAFARAVDLAGSAERRWRAVAEAPMAWRYWNLGLGDTREQRRFQESVAAPHRRLEGAVHWHEGGKGPVVLLLNGWTASGLVWPVALVERLERRHHVVRIDNRGSGWSRSAPAPFSIANLADDAAAVLAAADADRATVVGLSMGGMVAQELALRHPGAVDRLVLLATRPPAPRYLPPPGAVMAATMAPPSGPLHDHFHALWSSFCAPGFAAREPDLIEELVGQVLARPTPRSGVEAQARAIAGWAGADRLARITAPTTVVHGRLDPLMPVGNGMRLARLIPTARYVELDGVGHLPPVEALDTVAQIIEGRHRTPRRSELSPPSD